MAELELTLEGGHSAFRPGETATFELAWDLERVPEGLVVRLLWIVGNRSHSQRTTAWSEALETPKARDSWRCALELPDRPHSWNGPLLRVRWELEAEIRRPQHRVRVPLVVAPDGRALSPDDLEP